MSDENNYALRGGFLITQPYLFFTIHICHKNADQAKTTN